MKISNKFIQVGAAMALVLLTVTGSARADQLDFTNPFVWGAAQGTLSYTTNINGIQVTIAAGPGIPESTLSQTLFGLGVNWDDGFFDLDEGIPLSQQLDKLESLTVSFDRPVVLNSFTVSNFFKLGFGPFVLQTENGGFFYRDPRDISQGFRFDASGNLLGVQTITVNSAPTKAITWVARTTWDGWLDTAYSLRGLSFTPN